MTEPIRIPIPTTWVDINVAARSLAVIAEMAQAPAVADWNGDDLVVAPPDPLANGNLQDRARNAMRDWTERREARQAQERRAQEILRRDVFFDRAKEFIATQTQQIVVGGKVHVLTLVQAREGTGVEWEVETSSGCRTEVHYWPGTDLSGAVAYIAGIVPAPEPC